MASTTDFLHGTPKPLLILLLIFCLCVSAAGLYVAVLVIQAGRWPVGRLLFFGGFAWLSLALLRATLTYPDDSRKNK